MAGNIIVRQRGTQHHPDANVGIGRDHTLFALIDGKVVFRKKQNNKSYVSVIPFEEEAPASAKAEPKKTAAKAETPAKESKKAAAKADDLTVIEGVGPKIAEVFANAGLVSFADVAAKTADELKAILTDAGDQFNTAVTDTWAQQAQLAADGKWDELKKWQEELDGGKAAE